MLTVDGCAEKLIASHQGGAQVQLFCLDILLLGLPLLLLAIVSYMVVAPTALFFRMNFLLFLFFLPGWLITRRLAVPGCDLLDHYVLAAILAFGIYGLLGAICSWCSLSFTVFYFLFLGVLILTCGLVWRTYIRWGRPAKCSRVAILFLVLIPVLLLIVLLYRSPYFNDLGQFTGILSDFEIRKDFRFSAYGAEFFGLTEPMPRYRTHLFHILIALFGDIGKMNVFTVNQVLLNAPYGALMLLAMFCFVRSIAGRSPPAPALFLSILAPILLAWNDFAGFCAYDLSFRIMNGPTVDKDFCLFFILPACGYLAAEFLKTGRKAWFILLLSMTVPVLCFHPMTSVYMLMLSVVLGCGFFKAAQYQRYGALFLLALFWFLVCFLNGTAQAGHASIDLIAHRNFHKGFMHYWPGHYSSIPGFNGGCIRWISSIMALDYKILWYSNFIKISLAATGIWLLLLLRKANKMRRCGRPFRLAKTEAAALRVQLAYVCSLVTIFFLSPVFLNLWPHLWRGYERLHWMFLGVFAFIFVFYRLIQTLRHAIGVWATAVVYFLFFLIVTDQIQAFLWEQSTYASRFFFLRSVADDKTYLKKYSNLDAISLTPGPFASPAWMRDDDRIASFILTPPIGISKNVIYWPELYGEAWAYEKFGEAFLSDYDGFHENYESYLKGYLSKEAKEWLVRQKVSILYQGENKNSEKYFSALVEAGCLLEKISPTIWRINGWSPDGLKK